MELHLHQLVLSMSIETELLRQVLGAFKFLWASALISRRNFLQTAIGRSCVRENLPPLTSGGGIDLCCDLILLPSAAGQDL